ncbi:MAG: hypothetical protein KDA24_20205 [Deltaproteobacteria bacterium]|nr:hypothetical protein [Deltaproteobacteria bacterium]
MPATPKSLLPLLLLVGCTPQLDGAAPTWVDPFAPVFEEPVGAAYFAVLGPSNSGSSTNVIILDSQGNEVRRLAVGNQQDPFEESFTLSWHHAGFFLVSTAGADFLTAVDPVTRDIWEFGADAWASSMRNGVSSDGGVVAAAWSELFALAADGDVVEQWEMPEGGPAWTDAIETEDGMLVADYNGLVTRLSDGAVVHDSDGAWTDFVGVDGSGAMWMGHISQTDLTWVEPEAEAVHLGAPGDLGLHPFLLSLEGAGPESVWALNIESGGASSRVSQVDRRGVVRHHFEVSAFWTDLIVLDETYPQAAQDAD